MFKEAAAMSSRTPALLTVVVLLTSQLLLLCECEVLSGVRLIDNTCKIPESRCHGGRSPWQRDGVCWEPGVCYAPAEVSYSFTVVARVRTLQVAADNSAAKPIKMLWIRGVGIGLDWNKPVELRKIGSSMDSWKASFSYRSSSDAIVCSAADFCSNSQRALEFRLYRDQLGKDEMLGPNFYFPLPLSHSMAGGADFLSPTLTVHPWFDGREVTQKKFDVGGSYGLKTSATILYPPSFNYNTLKKYPLVLVFGDKPTMLSSILEYLYIFEASVQEAVVVVVEPFKALAPYTMLSPYFNSYTWMCKTSNCFTNCQTCWILMRDEPCDAEDFKEQAKRCLSATTQQAKGDQILDIIERGLLPIVKQHTKDRVLADSSEQQMSIIGVDGAGLLACYAAISRPHIYKNAGCLSAPFYWPLNSSLSEPTSPSPGIFNTLSDLKRKNINPLLFSHQRYYIEIMEREHEFLPIVHTNEYVERFLNELQTTLHLKQENVMFLSIPGVYNYVHHKKSSMQLFHRIHHALRFFLRAEGGPNKEGARVQSVHEKTIAEQKELYGHLVSGKTNNDSVTQSCEDLPIRGISKPTEVPIKFFIPALGLSVVASVLVTVIVMCLREMNRKEVEEAEKEEEELLDAMASGSDMDDDDL